MLSWKAWVQRPSGLIKMEGSASTFKIMKVENVALKSISIIDLKSSWKAWVQRPSGLIKVGGSTNTFMREYLD
jgi:hypothetical protein